MTSASVRFWRALLVVLALATSTRTAFPEERSRVVLFRPAERMPATTEALTRLDAELRAGGFDVVTVDRPLEPDVRSTLEHEATARGAFAAIVIIGSRTGASADVWIVDRATGKTLVRTVEVKPRAGESAPAVLAIRAVELLRASLLESEAPLADLAVPAAPKKVPPDVARWTRDTGRDSPYVYRLAAGGAMIHAFDGVGPGFAPALRLSWGTDALAARLTVVGPAVGPSLDVDLGQVSVRQELAALEAVFSRRIGTTRFVPRAHAGAGVFHLAAVGALDPPNRGASDDAWAVFFATGIGFGIAWSDRVLPYADVSALFTEPQPVIVVSGESVGRAGRPSLLATLGLEVRL